MLEIITKEQAILLGVDRYFTGKPCANKHISQRRVSSGKCVKCCLEWQKNKILTDSAYAESQRKTKKIASKKRFNSLTEEQKDAKRILNKKYYYDNIDHQRKRARERQAALRKTDLEYRIKTNISWYMWRFAKKGGVGTSKAIEQRFGYTIAELKIHIEKQFLKGMSWDNYGMHGWHIDHIVPKCAFDFSKDEEFNKCWSLSNLRPLWAKDNKIKNGKSVFLL